MLLLGSPTPLPDQSPGYGRVFAENEVDEVTQAKRCGTFEVQVKLHPEEGPHSLAMLLARSRIETIPTTASPSITGRCRNPPKSI